MGDFQDKNSNFIFRKKRIPEATKIGLYWVITNNAIKLKNERNKSGNILIRKRNQMRYI